MSKIKVPTEFSEEELDIEEEEEVVEPVKKPAPRKRKPRPVEEDDYEDEEEPEVLPLRTADRASNIAIAERSTDRVRQALAQTYKVEGKVPVSISPSYRPHFGSTAMISVNGISVYVPCDGRAYSINATHAAELFETIDRIDLQLTRQQGASNMSIESSPGSLKF